MDDELHSRQGKSLKVRQEKIRLEIITIWRRLRKRKVLGKVNNLSEKKYRNILDSLF
jgi:hypothetical protein